MARKHEKHRTPKFRCRDCGRVLATMNNARTHQAYKHPDRALADMLEELEHGAPMKPADPPSAPREASSTAPIKGKGASSSYRRLYGR